MGLPHKAIAMLSETYYALFEACMYRRLIPLRECIVMFSYERVKERPQLFLAMTGLTRTEFEQFLPYFHKAWEEYIQRTSMAREDRQRAYGGGREESTLVTLEDKLLFILYDAKIYPLQEILAFEFDMVQSTANAWIHILSDVLKQA
jgi:hypothetical protein